jgi:trehalose 6-phosphate phosphatase
MAAASDPARDAAIAWLRRDPTSTALLLDFDGTLAPIVTDPAAAAPLPGAGEALVRLAERFAVVAVVSGRPVAHLRRHLPSGIDLIGLYGLERFRDGRVEEHPAVAPWRPVVAAAVAAARAELPAGVGIEDKGLSLTLHVRPRPELADVVREWATATGARTGLEVRQARMSTELHPPVAADKGSVTAALVTGMSTACFVGDDIGDLPAFAALDAFAATGGAVVRAVVTSSEVAPELVAVADVLLSGPDAVLGLLRALAN